MILLALLAASPILLAFADSTGTLIGKIRNFTTWENISGAKITVSGQNKFEKIVAYDGNYIFSGLPAGQYSVTVNCRGYKSKTNDSVRIKAESIINLDFALLSETADIADIIESIWQVGAQPPSETFGIIYGVVTDFQSGLPIPGARILIDSTPMGAMVNPCDGSYVILFTIPGVYNLTADCIGYNKLKIKKVEVNSNAPTEINFDLVSEPIRCGNIRMWDGPPMIDKEVSKKVRLDRGQISKMPHNSIDKVIKYLCD